MTVIIADELTAEEPIQPIFTFLLSHAFIQMHAKIRRAVVWHESAFSYCF
jgi:hypothetical protein